MSKINYEIHDDGILIEVSEDELYILHSNRITNGSAMTGLVLDYFEERKDPIQIYIACDKWFQKDMLEEIAEHYRKDWERIDP